MWAQWELGETIQGRPLRALAVAPGQQVPPGQPQSASWPWLLFLGGVHGDEVEGVWALEALREKWEKAFPSWGLGAILFAPVNPDGFAAGRRWNANDVDLNRNLPTGDWTPEALNPRYPPGPRAASEPESVAVVKLIGACRPRAILSVHSFAKYQVNINGPSRRWGETLARLCGYPLTEDIGYPTPGCLGTYAGRERAIPCITLEIERGLPRDEVVALHLPVLEASMEFWAKEK